jgi:hypothetical protein
VVRTMLVAVLAKAVGYGGAVIGWEREPGRPYRTPNSEWWSVDPSVRKAAQRTYLAAPGLEQTEAAPNGG